MASGVPDMGVTVNETVGRYSIECSPARTKAGYHVALVWYRGEILYIAMRDSAAAVHHLAHSYVSRKEG